MSVQCIRRLYRPSYWIQSWPATDLDVILYGPAARGDAGPDSDIDLLVVLDDDAPKEKLTYRAGMEARRPYNAPADLIACREDTYRRFSRIVGTLPYAARTAGIIVYER